MKKRLSGLKLDWFVTKQDFCAPNSTNLTHALGYKHFEKFEPITLTEAVNFYEDALLLMRDGAEKDTATYLHKLAICNNISKLDFNFIVDENAIYNKQHLCNKYYFFKMVDAERIRLCTSDVEIPLKWLDKKIIKGLTNIKFRFVLLDNNSQKVPVELYYNRHGEHNHPMLFVKASVNLNGKTANIFGKVTKGLGGNYITKFKVEQKNLEEKMDLI